MSYRLQPYETLPTGIKRIAREQIDKALLQLTEAPEGTDEAVHDARKRFKKIRAVLRLVRDEIGESVYKRENVCFRDVGRLLSPVRDSVVMLETLEGVLEGSDLTRADVEPAHQRLAYAHQYQHDELIERQDVLARAADTIRAARERVAAWPVEHEDFSALHDGHKRVYKRGRKRLADAYDDPKPENFHEWRKRVKYLWYHTRILRLLWDDPLDEVADAIHDLSDYLGDAHDLAELRATIADLPETPDSAENQRLLALIAERRAELQHEARPLGLRIYAEKPSKYLKRMGAYWDAWESGARAV